MAENSKIEWLAGGSTWNPIRAELLEDIVNPATKEVLHHKGDIGWFCIRKSPGCKGCYACRMNLWRGNGLDYNVPNLSKVRIFLDEKTLLQPLKWREPRLVFPCSMTDWMDDFVPPEFRDKMLAVMALTPRNTYLTLTKEAGNQQKYMTTPGLRDQISQQMLLMQRSIVAEAKWPLPNLWLGTSVENQQYADERIPLLLQTPAAVRWISAEPLLGPVDFKQIKHPTAEGGDVLTGIYRGGGVNYCTDRFINWVVAGGESGPNARPMHPDWARSLRDQCQAARVPFFFKQWGEWANGSDCRKEELCLYRDGRSCDFTQEAIVAEERRSGIEHRLSGGTVMAKLGKKAAGRLLDGKEHSEYPEAHAH